MLLATSPFGPPPSGPLAPPPTELAFAGALRVHRDRLGLGLPDADRGRVARRLLAGSPTLVRRPGGPDRPAYECVAPLLAGPTVVVCPLVAVIADRVDALRRRGLAAERLDSGLDAGGMAAARRRLRAEGRGRSLYLTPERLADERVLTLLAELPVALVVVEEAQCLGRGGPDHRPEYEAVARLVAACPGAGVLAWSSAVAPAVADEVAAALGVPDANVLRLGFDRPLPELRVTRCRPGHRDAALLARIAAGPPAPVVVAAPDAPAADRLTALLAGHGREAVAVHHALSSWRRGRALQQAREAAAPAIVAADPFVATVDRPDVRALYHCHLPASPAHYARQLGVLARDGGPADAELLLEPGDPAAAEARLAGPPEAAALTLTGDLLGRGPAFRVTPAALTKAHGLTRRDLRVLLDGLERTGPGRWSRPAAVTTGTRRGSPGRTRIRRRASTPRTPRWRSNSSAPRASTSRARTPSPHGGACRGPGWSGRCSGWRSPAYSR